METRIAKIITYIFHPMLMPLYTLVLIFHLNIFSVYIIPDNIMWMIMGMVFVSVLVLPIMIIMMLVRRGIISSYKLEQREERLFPYAIMAIMYYIMYYLLSSIHIPSIISDCLLGATILVILSLIINFKWKISAHMTGIGGMSGTFIGISVRYLPDLRILIFLTILSAGFVGFARLKLNTHKPSEVYTGLLMGVVVMLLLYILN